MLLWRYCVQVRRGNYRVQEHHHTVVMNWNKQLLPVLQQVGGAGWVFLICTAPSACLHGAVCKVLQ